MRSKLVLSDVQIVVERRGHGAAVWYWRLVKDIPGAKLNPLTEAPCGYRSAECAYQAATASLRDIQQTKH